MSEHSKTTQTAFTGPLNTWDRGPYITLRGDTSPGRHWHSTLTVIDCRSLGFYTVILLLLLSLSAKMTVLRPRLGDTPGKPSLTPAWKIIEHNFRPGLPGAVKRP